MRLFNRSRGHELAEAVQEADSFGRRLRGLMFRKRLGPGEGMLFRPCQAIHTHFMRFPIDVIFVDDQWRVLQVIASMRPWRTSPFVRRAAAVIELQAGAADATEPGDLLELQP